MRTLLLLLAACAGAAETYRDPKAAAYYAEHKDFFRFATPADLPKDRSEEHTSELQSH